MIVVPIKDLMKQEGEGRIMSFQEQKIFVVCIGERLEIWPIME